MKTPYQIDHEYKTIALTRNFAKAANKYRGKEYTLLAKLKQDFPDYQIELRNIRTKKDKQSYNGLNYEMMYNHIQTVHGEEALNDFLFQMDLNHNEAGAYGRVKKWFLAEHPDYNED